MLTVVCIVFSYRVTFFYTKSWCPMMLHLQIFKSSQESWPSEIVLYKWSIYEENIWNRFTNISWFAGGNMKRFQPETSLQAFRLSPLHSIQGSHWSYSQNQDTNVLNFFRKLFRFEKSLVIQQALLNRRVHQNCIFLPKILVHTLTCPSGAYISQIQKLFAPSCLKGLNHLVKNWGL